MYKEKLDYVDCKIKC